MRIQKPPLRTIALAFIAVSLLTAFAVFAGDDHPASHERERQVTVPVSFVSRPSVADLYIDGKFVGSTEVALRLSPGVHVIEVKLDDFHTWRRELHVTAGSPTRVAALLKPQK
jgi:PEGA domain